MRAPPLRAGTVRGAREAPGQTKQRTRSTKTETTSVLTPQHILPRSMRSGASPDRWTTKPNRPRFLRGQGWLCLAAVVEHEWKVGAVPLMLRLVRRGPHRGKLKSAGFLLRLLGNQLGRVRVLLDAWFMRAWLIECALAASHTVIARDFGDLALYEVPKPPGPRGRGRPRKYGERMRRQKIEALPVHRTAQILYGNLDVV